MKPFVNSLATTFLFTFSTCLPFAQDLSHLIPSAHYTLINTAEDALGLQLPVELIHMPFAGDDGVYSNGISISDDPDQGSLMQTPFLDALYDSVFALQFEFKVADLDELWRPAFVCGGSYRYLGLLTGADSSFYALLNNANYIKIDNSKVVVGQWYEVTVIHFTPDSLTEFYLDGIKVHELHVPLDRNMSDGNILNSNFASGKVFKGYCRNLRVYGSEGTTGIDDADPKSNGIHGLTTLVKDILSYEYTAGQASCWKIADMRGQVLMSGRLTEGLNEISTRSLIPGMYLIYFADDKDKLVCIEKFLKME